MALACTKSNTLLWASIVNPMITKEGVIPMLLSQLPAEISEWPECLSGAPWWEATPQALAKAVGRLLTDPEAAADQARRQTEALDLMGRGGPDPSELAADAVLRVIAAKAG